MIGKIITAGFVLLLLGYSIWWLWQRQPKPKTPETPKIESSKESPQEPKEEIDISPKNFSVLTKGAVKIEGKLSPNSYVLIYSNDSSSVAKSDENGKFTSQINLADGLNLIGLVQYSKEPKELSKKTLIYYGVSEDKKSAFGQTVFTGSVKNIFDRNFTISVISSDDKNVNTTKSTTLEIPQDKEEATLSAVDAVRVGDFAITTGDLASQFLNAKYFKILRENKPQINKNVAIVKILSNVRQNAISANNIVNSKTEEFTLSKTSTIQDNDNVIDSKKIEKNKTAIVVFSEEKGKKNLNYIYILP